MNAAPSPADGDRLAYGIAEAMQAASVGRTLLYEAIAAKRLRARKAGNRTLILKTDLQAWLESLPEAKEGQ
jgi:excisionase family DNA binding protein